MVWFGGILSWYAVVCEGVVPAPLWAFSHLDGEGEGMGQRTAHGYTFMLNLMLRPVFMVIGFLLASIGISVFGALLNVMFAAAMANAQYNSITGIVSIIGYVALYVGMCQTLCQTLFGLVNHTLNASFAWIGASMHNTFGHDTHDKSHSIIAGAVETGGGHVQRGLGGGRSTNPSSRMLKARKGRKPEELSRSQKRPAKAGLIFCGLEDQSGFGVCLIDNFLSIGMNHQIVVWIDLAKFFDRHSGESFHCFNIGIRRRQLVFQFPCVCLPVVGVPSMTICETKSIVINRHLYLHPFAADGRTWE